MFFKKNKEYKKITREELRTMERIQEIKKEILKLNKDFYNLEWLGWHRTFNAEYGAFTFEDDYQKVLKKYILEKTEKLHEEMESLIRGDE